MVYESDLNNLLSQWQEITHKPFVDPSYLDGVNDCIYDLKMLVDKQFQEEIMAKEAFEQQLEEDKAFYKDLENMLANGRIC